MVYSNVYQMKTSDWAYDNLKDQPFYDEMKIPDKCSFYCSWLRNFKECHGIRKLDNCGEVMSVDAEAAEEYSIVQVTIGND